MEDYILNKLSGLFSRENKESVSSGKHSLTVNKNRCPQNHACPAIRVCPADALSQNGFSAPKVDMEKCIVCGKCVRYCPMGALRLE